MSDESNVWKLLEEVKDPEIPTVSVVDLGIIRGVEVVNREARITVTPTYSGCPALHAIETEIHATLSDAGFTPRLVTQYAPPWTTDWLTEKGRQGLKESGIAPPACLAGAQGALQSSAAAEELVQFPRQKFPWQKEQTHSVACPRCESSQTEERSHFGSTACKALYYCNACHQPFDYFKPF